MTSGKKTYEPDWKKPPVEKPLKGFRKPKHPDIKSIRPTGTATGQ